MTTVCFTCSGPKAVQNQVAKMAAIGAQSRSGTVVCLPTDVQLLSSKGLRVLVLVDDESADLVANFRGWERFDAIGEGGGEGGAPTVVASCPIPEWVTTDRRTERLHTLLTCTFNLASLLFMLFDTTETISPKLKSWLATVYKTNVERSFSRVKPISDARKVSLCYLADKWRDHVAELAEPEAPPEASPGEPSEEWVARAAFEAQRAPLVELGASPRTNNRTDYAAVAPKINTDDLKRLYEVAYLGPTKNETMWFVNKPSTDLGQYLSALSP